jgi:hypothetical protein
VQGRRGEDDDDDGEVHSVLPALRQDGGIVPLRRQ